MAQAPKKTAGKTAKTAGKTAKWVPKDGTLPPPKKKSGPGPKPGNKGGQAAKKARGPGLDPERGRNPAYQRVWLGCEEWQARCGEHLYARPMLARMMEEVLVRHEAEIPTSCMQMSLLAHARGPLMVAHVDKLPWGLTTVKEFEKTVRDWARKFEIYTQVYRVANVDGFRLIQSWFSVGTAAKQSGNAKLLVIDGEVGHCVPVSKIDWDWYETLPPPPTLAASPSPPPSESSACAPSDGSAKAPEAPVGPQAQSSPPDGANPVRSGWAKPAQGQPKPQPKAAPMQQVQAVLVPAADPMSELRPLFDGLYPVIGPWEVRAIQSTRFMRQCSFLPNLACSLLRPGYCHATLRNASVHGDSVRYIAVEPYGCLVEVSRERCTFTDGVQVHACFREGDILEGDEEQYQVIPEEFNGLKTLRLIRISAGVVRACSSMVRSLFGPFVPLSPVPLRRICRGTRDMGEEQEERTRWHYAIHMESDAIVASNAKRVRDFCLEAETAEYDRQRPEALMNRMRDIREGFGPEVMIGGIFGWGYCFTCGRMLQSERMPGRLCDGCRYLSKQPTPPTTACSLIQAGESPVTAACPIRYPGLVQLKSRHPPLKRGTETLALEGGNFRVAPQA